MQILSSLLYTLIVSFIFIVNLSTTTASPPPVPVIPPQFYSTADVYLRSSSEFVFKNATYYNDVINQATTITNLWLPVPDNPQYGLNVTAHVVPGGLYYVNNGVCRKYPGGWGNVFAFVQSPDITYQGTVSINNRLCDQWQLVSGATTLSLAAIGNTPVLLNITSIVSDTLTSYTIIYFWDDVVVAAPPSSISKLPARCTGPGFLCPHGAVANITMIRFHTATYWGLDNKNTADITGDTVFICTTLATDTHQYDELISIFEVQVNTSWGRYGKCNGGYCFGSNSYSVGRSAGWTASYPPGQCLTNYLFGDWYSMTKRASCAENQNVGPSCAWKIIRRIKTINGTCAFNNYGMAAACANDSVFPFASAGTALKRALQGCPALSPPSEKVFIDSSEDDYRELQRSTIIPPVEDTHSSAVIGKTASLKHSTVSESLNTISQLTFGLYTEFTIPG